MKFSIIVPVYNVEEYLSKCLDSILSQQFDDYEVVLVDDGSSDKSGIICDNYKQKDSRIKVIHKKNGGLSSARNTGINISEGQYLIFVDSDDWIEQDSLALFNSIICKCSPDVIETVIIEEYEDYSKKNDSDFESYLVNEFTKERAVKWMMKYSENTWPAPKRICKREFIISNNLYFSENRLQEDVDWTTRLCFAAHSFYGCSKHWYHYRMKREGSITNSINGKYITDIIEMAAAIKHNKRLSDCCSEYVFSRMMKTVYISINCYKMCNNKDKDNVVKCLERNMWIFDFAPSFRYKLFSFMVKMLGIECSLEILSKIG